MIGAAATRHRRLVWSLTAIYWLVLFTATHLPPSDLPKVHVNDKIEHMLAFGLLTIALHLSLLPKRWPALRLAAVVLTIVLIYGAGDELTQPFTGRSCSIYDWYADAAAAVIASAVMMLVVQAARRNGESRPLPNPNDQTRMTNQ